MRSIKYNNGREIEVGKIVCVGRNYAEHAKELGNEIPEFPLIFLKPSSVLIPSGGQIVHPDYSSELHHEVELVLLIGEKVKSADRESAQNAIHGYGVGLDMTLRDIQFKLKDKGHPWTLAKVFDTAAVVSDFTDAAALTLTGDEQITLSVNGEIRQNSTLNKMLFMPAQIVEYISGKMTLEPGDLIFTGTPKGVGKVIRGDKIDATIQGVAHLTAEVI